MHACREGARAFRMCLCAQLNSAPSMPAATDTRTMKGSCSNHSRASRSARPLKDSTPCFHLGRMTCILALPHEETSMLWTLPRPPILAETLPR